MPWQLTIHTIDVGQGDSALIVAEDVAAGVSRTMLIDGGMQMYTQSLDNAIAAILDPLGYDLDHILLTHYHDDHYGGIVGLLNADNMCAVCELIGDMVSTAVTWALTQGYNRPQQIVCGSIAAMAAIQGGFPPYAAQVQALCLQAAPGAAGLTDVAAANLGINTVNNFLALPLGYPLRVGGTAKKNLIAGTSGVTAANAVAAGAVLANAVYRDVFPLICTTLVPDLQIDTEGRYKGVHVLDIGAGAPPIYENAISGAYNTTGAGTMVAPTVARLRTTPGLGDEILWGTGVMPMAAPANSPAVFCLAINALVWQGVGVTPVGFTGGQPDNDKSIAMIIRFNDFYFYTGGDLPSEGELPLVEAVMDEDLPDPLGGPDFPTPACIAAIKCGHHGSAHSTSTDFLNTCSPVAAFISCGVSQFQDENHPSQRAINRLHRDPDMVHFYLTNCNYATVYVPASNGGDQLIAPGNKSRVAGQNHGENLDVGRHRGNIELSLTQNESQAAGGAAHQFIVSYYDDDAVLGAPVGVRNEIIPF